MQSGAPENNLVIDSGIKRVMINGDPNNYIQFNPSDVAFIERLDKLRNDIYAKDEEYKKRADAIDANTEVDSHGVKKNVSEVIAMRREVGEFMRAKIDDIFGDGVSKKLFGDSIIPEQCLQFLDGITPYIKPVRFAKVAQYAPPVVKPNHKGRKGGK